MNPWLQAAIVVGALLTSVFAGWGLSVGVLRLAKVPDVILPTLERDASGRMVPILAPKTAPSRPLLRGGLWVGILERLAITGAIIAGRPELIALVVAVKGLGRYPELQQAGGASERFIVGTLASFIVAVAVGLGAVALLA
ncbi:hypothetical protein [Propioniciclava sp.]|uniref:hypothetical protein n=1 Tax=Propioniciclava sp. TaxID=2038686 RepID=UPI002602060E|nr:hypothetical protein [Propioniciclava sp.]